MDDIDNELLLKAAKSLPRSEVEYVKRYMASVGIQDRSDAEIRLMLAGNRICNKICNKCGRKGRGVELVVCDKCCATWYCKGRDCATTDAEDHSRWCCRPMVRETQATWRRYS